MLTLNIFSIFNLLFNCNYFSHYQHHNSCGHLRFLINIFNILLMECFYLNIIHINGIDVNGNISIEIILIQSNPMI